MHMHTIITDQMTARSPYHGNEMNTLLAQFVSPDTLDTLANTRHPQKQRREGKLIQCSVIITVNSDSIVSFSFYLCIMIVISLSVYQSMSCTDKCDIHLCVNI